MITIDTWSQFLYYYRVNKKGIFFELNFKYEKNKFEKESRKYE